MDELPPGLEVFHDNQLPRATKQLVSAAKLSRALELRAAGFNYRQIGEDMGLGTSRARAIIVQALREHASEAVEDMRLIDGDRIEQVIGGIWERCLQGDLRAIDRLVLLLERKAKLFGLDQPVEINVTEIRATLFGTLRELLDAETYERVMQELAS